MTFRTCLQTSVFRHAQRLLLSDKNKVLHPTSGRDIHKSTPVIVTRNGTMRLFTQGKKLFAIHSCTQTPDIS
ncbi:hypothetical protein WKV47_24015, partial [Salmonella enterica]